MAAAQNEFGEKSYAEASLNTICKEGDISKGIIYHYFKDKDELFLACVQECFDALTAHLKKAVEVSQESIAVVIQKYFEARIAFFDQHPAYLKLFCSAVILPPPHLTACIAEIRQDFDVLNVTVLTALLEKVPLRSGLTIAEVVDEFKLQQDFINTHYQMQALKQVDIAEHEKRCNRTLEILLYGVIERTEA